MAYKNTLNVDRIDFFVKYLEPIPHFLVIFGFIIRGFSIRGQLTERIYRE
jgi:hypothetical protein